MNSYVLAILFSILISFLSGILLFFSSFLSSFLGSFVTNLLPILILPVTGYLVSVLMSILQQMENPKCKKVDYKGIFQGNLILFLSLLFVTLVFTFWHGPLYWISDGFVWITRKLIPSYNEIPFSTEFHTSTGYAYWIFWTSLTPSVPLFMAQGFC